MSLCLFSDNSISTDSHLNYIPKKELDEKVIESPFSSRIFSDLDGKNKLDKVSLKYSDSYQILKGKWSKEEDQRLINAVNYLGAKNWKSVAQCVEGRTSIQCLHRWSKILQPGLIKGPWTVEEDQKLIDWVNKEGAVKWSACAQFIKGRSGKQCRERYFNTLIPNVKKGNWTTEEDYLLFKLFNKYGSQWSKIIKFFQGRTENSIKNRFYSTLRRIATDKKKQKKFQDLIDEPYQTTFKGLCQYIPFAINEITLNYLSNNRKKKSSLKSIQNSFFIYNQNEDTLNNIHSMNNHLLNNIYPSLNINSFNSIEENSMIHKKDLLKNNINEEYNHYNNLRLETLQKTIEEFHVNPYNVLDNIESFIDTHINNFFSDFFHENQINEERINNIHRKTCVGCNMFDKNEIVIEENNIINNLINQIENLEELLKETKSELLSNNNINHS